MEYLDEVLERTNLTLEKTEKEENLVFPKDSEIHKEEAKLPTHNLYDTPNYLKEYTDRLAGIKHNQLKPRLDVVINIQFPKALQLVALASEYGNSKYRDSDKDMLNFKRVEGGSQTYFDSCARHSTDRNGIDESGLPHIIHAVWSSLAGLELWVEENNINIKDFSENYLKKLAQ